MSGSRLRSIALSHAGMHIPANLNRTTGAMVIRALTSYSASTPGVPGHAREIMSFRVSIFLLSLSHGVGRLVANEPPWPLGHGIARFEKTDKHIQTSRFAGEDSCCLWHVRPHFSMFSKPKDHWRHQI